MRKAMCERLALDIREVCDFAPDGIRPGEVLALMEAEIDGITIYQPDPGARGVESTQVVHNVVLTPEERALVLRLANTKDGE